MPKAFTLLFTLGVNAGGGSHIRQRSSSLSAQLRFLLQRLRLWAVDSRTVQEMVGKVTCVRGFALELFKLPLVTCKRPIWRSAPAALGKIHGYGAAAVLKPAAVVPALSEMNLFLVLVQSGHKDFTI